MTGPRFGPAPRRKLYHRAALVDGVGNVSALCYRKPRPIDLKRASWTIVDRLVTCPACQKAIAARDKGKAE